MPLDIWNMMSVDMVKLEPNKTSYNFFESDGKNDGSSIRELANEDQVVKFAFTNQTIRDFVISEFIPADGRYTLLMNVQEPFTNDNAKPGDIDIIIVPKENESESIAIEVKYFKAITLEDNKTKVNKVEKILKTIDQVNNYRKFGFHKIYFAIILIDDARLEATQNFLLKRTKNDLIDKIYWEHNFEQISSEIGIVFIELVQSLNKSHNHSINVKTKTKRPATAISQSLQATEKIKRLIFEDLS